MKLEGKTALVTGASRGIGRAIALAFAREGARVAINYRANEEAAREAKALADAAGPTALLARADVTDRAQVEAMLEACFGEFGRLDILVNNASAEVHRRFWELTEEDWDFVQDSTLKSVFLCSGAAARHMIERGGGGKILNISSIHDAAPRQSASAYCAAKAGLLMLTRCCALELAPHNIQVNAISPGLIETDRTAGYIRRGNQQGKTNIGTAIPAHRAGRPEEIAEAAVYFVSDAAGYTTGTNIYVDGGYLLTTCRIP
jgi:NAD(P)-dependent dehydrogenase (short-subunit alcohol dehydrogenase family)